MSSNSNRIESQRQPDLKEQPGERAVTSQKEASETLSRSVNQDLASRTGLKAEQEQPQSQAQRKFGDCELPDLKIGGTYDIQSGQTMWGLSEQMLQRQTGHKPTGKEILQEIKALQKANPEIKDANKIYAGEHIKIPGQDAAEGANKQQGPNGSASRPNTTDSSKRDISASHFTERHAVNPSDAAKRVQEGDSIPKQPRASEQIEKHTTNDSVEQNKPQESDSAEPKGWTVAVNLTAQIGQDGVPHILNELEQLKQDSIGKPDVTFVIQYADQNREGAKTDSGNGWYVHRMVIKDGQVVPQEKDGRQAMQVDSPSQGYAQDITGLLKASSPYDQGTRLAFVNQSHGDGMRGVEGGGENPTTVNGVVNPNFAEYGAASPDQLAEAIKEGLGGRQKLDLLDLDCCLEGEGSVLGKLKGVTNDVVASPETESGGAGNADGQNLRAPLDVLLNNPNMTGSQLGDTFVQQANLGANNDGSQAGTSTLAHYDLTKLDGYNNALDKLGGELSELAQNPHDREVIQGIINHTTRYGADAPGIDPQTEQNRDMLMFLEKLSAADAANQLDDPGNKLMALINDVGAKEDLLVKSYYGAGGYNALGGLSELLPGVEAPQQPGPNNPNRYSQFLSELGADKADIHTEKDGQSMRPQWIEFLKTMNRNELNSIQPRD